MTKWAAKAHLSYPGLAISGFKQWPCPARRLAAFDGDFDNKNDDDVRSSFVLDTNFCMLSFFPCQSHAIEPLQFVEIIQNVRFQDIRVSVEATPAAATSKS